MPASPLDMYNDDSLLEDHNQTASAPVTAHPGGTDSVPRQYYHVPQSSVADLQYEATGFPRDDGGTRVVEPVVRSWTPIPLRMWFAVSLSVSMLLGAMALEIALHFSRVQQGWSVPSRLAATTGTMHFVYTLPPVAVTMVYVALWAWTDMQIKRLQPYIDLAYGNAPASRTMLLDYTELHPAIVTVHAFRHSHYLVLLSSCMVLVGLTAQPIAASLFTVKETWWNIPDLTITGFKDLGLDPGFRNLTTYSAAAGFVQANVLYNATPPNYVKGVWAIAPVEVPSDRVANGSMIANTTSVRSRSHCTAAQTSNITPLTNATGFTMSGTSNGCNISISVQSNPAVQSGVGIVTCPGSPLPDSLKPVVFWTIILLPSTQPSYSLVSCTPTVELLNVTTQVALQTGDLQDATILTNYSQPSNITDPNGPLQGGVLNGLFFDSSATDSLAQQSAQATRLGVTTAITQKAITSPGGLKNQIESSGMVNLTASIYELYLSLIANQNYFVPARRNMKVGIKTFQARLFIVAATAHILTGVLVALACLAAVVHFCHHRMRGIVFLPHRPGTLASVAAITARSNVGDVLDGQFDEATLLRLLKDKRLGIDKITGRLVVEGDVGYATGTVTNLGRSSFFGLSNADHGFKRG